MVDKFGNWKAATPEHNALVNAMLGARLHIVATVRSKMEYAQVLNPDKNRYEVVRLGMKPIQRDNLEYEFDVICEMDSEAHLKVIKDPLSRSGWL